MDSTLACLAAWMPRQRWYAAKGRPPSLRLIAWWDLPTDPGATVRTFLVSDEGSLPPVLYQLPVVARATAAVEASPDHVIGSPEPGTTFIDGPHDPAYAGALLQLVTEGGDGRGPGTVITGTTTAPGLSGAGRRSRVLAGEQSNTSIIYESADGAVPVICKVFRQLHAGLNPDIELQTALANHGSPHVPRAIGSVEGTWPDTATRGTVTGSLAFAQEFLPDVDDAWRVALRAAAAGEDFTVRARDLGAATADVHLDLAELFPTVPSGPDVRDAMSATWLRRLAIAEAEVPAIAERREAIEAVYERALDAAWPPLQRIHGDYHLGQVLGSPEHGWMLLDFEGEPLRPMAERRSPDLALRDVAGMLRSFDYVAGSIRLDQPDRSPEGMLAWARAARQAFLDGYAQVADVDLALERTLLAALELDKAVYEAIYEARNRPTWVAIPLRAIGRLVGQPSTTSLRTTA
ncbi:hypothetical protein [Microbacterium sp. RU33B]|uniref:maltokinase N-terminal cap-like domain-containing protein n=1 Tax=Microbacterium sp. RU33B TaxID=1907390 RepID=UPI00095B6583|nr:hypothetical protein [Microbacterium sp. RU33B]SIT71930.1 Predicted trehalose synthase [Microbacterium sp. RU33B]